MSSLQLQSALRRGTRTAVTIRRQATAAALFAFLFSVVAIAQYAFVRHQPFSVARSDADAAASDIAATLGGDTGLNVREYRQAFFPASEWFVVSADGSVIDAQCSAPGLLRRVNAFTNLTFGEPQTFVSEWLMFASLTAPQAANIFAIWSSSSTRSVTTTNVQLPATLSKTFCAKNTIENDFPERYILNVKS